MTELENIITRLKIGRADFHDLRGAINAAVSQARVEERESIAKLVADELSLFSCTCCQRVLKAIRARVTQ